MLLPAISQNHNDKRLENCQHFFVKTKIKTFFFVLEAPRESRPIRPWANLFGTTKFVIRPPVRSNGRSYKTLVMFLFSPPNLRAPSADRRETSPHDRNLCQFYKLTPKIRGALPLKNWGPKTCKISVDFIQPPTLIANISGPPQNIQNPKTNSSTAIPPASNEKVRWTLVH